MQGLSISDDVRAKNYLATEMAITKARWFVIGFLFFYLNMFRFPGYPVVLFNGLLVVAVLYNLGISIAVKKATCFSVKLTLLSLYCDLIAVSAGVYVTGGAESPFLFIWYLTLFKFGARFGFFRSLWIQAPLGLFYLLLLQRDTGITSIEAVNRLVFGLFAISAASLYGALFSREEEYTVNRLCDVHREAITDRLTGLYNYAYFQEELKREEARAMRGGTNLALAILDIDHFKKVNDTYGHDKGNVLLKRVADIIRSSARTTDLVARYGGEEFVVLMPDCKGAEMEAAERIRQKVEEAEFPDIAGAPVKITISAGVSSYPGQAASLTELVEKADKGLYLAKNAGRNRTKRHPENCLEFTPAYAKLNYQPEII